MTAISGVLGSLVVMALAYTLVGERLGFNSSLRHRILLDQRLCHLLNPLLHLVASIISKLKTHEDMLSPWRGECDNDQCLGGLAV